MSDEIRVGEWYLCAECRTCQESIPIIATAPHQRASGDGSFVFRAVPCPFCGAQHNYRIGELEPLQVRAAAPPGETRH